MMTDSNIVGDSLASWQPDSDFGREFDSLGTEMYEFAKRIFLFPRSITGDGVRDTLRAVKDLLPGLDLHEVPTGTKCFDWIAPDEWNVKDAYIADMAGNRVVDLKDNNLHLVGYSEPVDAIFSREELDGHLHSIPDMPDAIPYVTSYYRRTWGFCISHDQRRAMTESRYRVMIDTSLTSGHLTYADLLIPGESTREILLSTYTCHPAMANNEVSGPVLLTFLARYLSARKNRYSYRIIFVPETIGPVVYMARNLDVMKERTLAGYVLTCVGDDRAFSYMPSRRGDTVADRAALRVLERYAPNFVTYDFLRHRGSDERQYCSPRADLPVASIMRTRYGSYGEYHTSRDDLSVISPAGFTKSFYIYRKVCEHLENLQFWRAKYVGEPQLSRRNYRDTLGGQRTALASNAKLISDILALSDGYLDSLAIAELTGKPAEEVDSLCRILADDGLLEMMA